MRKTLKESKLSSEVTTGKLDKKIVKPEGTKKLILPYDLVLDYLKHSQIVKNSTTHPQDIYNGINLFLERNVPEIVEPDKPEYTKLQPNCQECKKGYLIIDRQEGCEVCNYCGLIQTMRTVNIEPEFVKPPEVAVKNCSNRIKGVTKTVIDMTNRNSDSYKPEKSFMEDLLHFNVWTNVPEDDLGLLEYKLKKNSQNKSVSYNGKVIGALLSHVLKDSLICESSFRDSIKNGNTVESIPTSPVRHFKCATCNEGCYSMKEARIHCSKLKTYYRKFK